MTHLLESEFAPKHSPYSQAEAVREADRCFYCYDPPCTKACPTSIDIPTFIKKIATNNVISSAKTILDANILGSSCAKSCPVEVLCAGACVYNALHEPPIAIGRLQDYATTFAMTHSTASQIMGPKKSATNKKVALIGGGPASLAAAALLAQAGIAPTIYEKNKNAGGLNAYGVAPYKLKHHEAQHEVDWLTELGIEFRLGVEVGTTVSWHTLLDDYDGIFIGAGLGADNFLPLENLSGPGVMGACDVVAKIKSDPHFSVSHIKKAHVIGGGNTAVDIAHELKKLGVPQVWMLYRKGIKEMSAYEHEVHFMQQAGVHIQENVELRTIKRDADGNLVGFTTTVSEAITNSDLIVMAIGQAKTRDHFAMPNVPFNVRGRIIVDPLTHRVKDKMIWAAGDAVNGGKEVVNAVAEAKLAVADMIRVLA